MTLNSGERQVAPTLDGIRKDHRSRYEWAAGKLSPQSSVVDLACGIGYGTAILAAAGHRAAGIDHDNETIAYAREHYFQGESTFLCWDASEVAGYERDSFDAAVCFETIEHISNPLPVLEALNNAAPLLIASVPNEAEFPWLGYTFHERHYTKAEFEALLNAAGWEVREWWGQLGPESDVEPGAVGRTLIAVCERGVVKAAAPVMVTPAAAVTKVPDHVLIIGLGPSAESYVDLVKRLGGRKKLADEVWAINALGDILQCDRIFHMDDVRIQEIRAAAKPQSNIAAMLDWMKGHPGPIYTSRAHPDYPGLVEFPLEAVLNNLGYGYFNNTAAYAAAYAIHIGVKKISLYGCDYTYPNAHDAEKGRGCLEYWLGYARARGIDIGLASNTSLMDSAEPEGGNQRLYGYDSVTVDIAEEADGSVRVIFAERETLPTAEQIEHRYDHSRHTNPLVKK